MALTSEDLSGVRQIIREEFALLVGSIKETSEQNGHSDLTNEFDAQLILHNDNILDAITRRNRTIGHGPRGRGRKKSP